MLDDFFPNHGSFLLSANGMVTATLLQFVVVGLFYSLPLSRSKNFIRHACLYTLNLLSSGVLLSMWAVPTDHASDVPSSIRFFYTSILIITTLITSLFYASQSDLFKLLLLTLSFIYRYSILLSCSSVRSLTLFFILPHLFFLVIYIIRSQAPLQITYLASFISSLSLFFFRILLFTPFESCYPCTKVLEVLERITMVLLPDLVVRNQLQPKFIAFSLSLAVFVLVFLRFSYYVFTTFIYKSASLKSLEVNDDDSDDEEFVLDDSTVDPTVESTVTWEGDYENEVELTRAERDSKLDLPPGNLLYWLTKLGHLLAGFGSFGYVAMDLVIE
ncbi:hypothetical protein P9112_000580 [Eukaryota sp. TZLM1-RC]